VVASHLPVGVRARPGCCATVPAPSHAPLPPEIRVLSEVVANQIAAGEVIERPAAVVKELAENSLDAGATRITVRIADGGRRLVEIEDDGHGMRPTGLRTALLRHATSKLADADDLFRIGTLGFRGEALPSIAAVSEFELASRPHDVAEGQVLRLEGGREIAFQAIAMGPGTRVSVRNLFWNVPARLKFLKSESAETGHVTDQVIRLALSHPRVAIRLECDERTVLDLPAGEIVATRVRTLFGKDLAHSLLTVSGAAEGMELIGFVAHPREAKPTAKRQYVFLNGRFVRDKLLLAAVREGFKGFLEPRLHGAVFLHLDLEPALVDVNVHPTKSEVRFRKEGEVFVLVSQAINKALAANSGGFGLLRNDEQPSSTTFTMAPGYSRTVVKPAAPSVPPVAPAPPQVVVQERFLPQTTHVEPAAPARVAAPIVSYASQPPTANRQPPAAALPPGIRRVVQLHDMFLLIETETGIRLIDQHALHEKALFLCLDPARTDVLRSGVQPLLVPRSIELSASEVAVIGPLLADLLPYGIEAEVFGPATLLLRAHPAVLKRVNWQAFFSALAASGSQSKAVDALRERIAHSAACHGAVKAGQVLSEAEQLELVRLLYELEHMEHCPHGRPTTLDLSWTELAKRFQR
jgi:DNA mismatch repair protein MutL